MILLLGAVTIFLLPVLGARYSLALPVAIAQNDKAVNALFESREYVIGQTRKIGGIVFYSNFTLLFAVVFLTVVLSYFIENTLIFWGIIIFSTTFLILPIHASFRFLLYKKLQNLTGEFKLETSTKEKIWFVILRIALLAILIQGSWMIINAGFFDQIFYKVGLFFHKFIT